MTMRSGKEASLRDSARLDLTALTAGLVVQAQVVAAIESGLHVTLLGGIKGTVDYLHLGLPIPSLEQIEKNFKAGGKKAVKARILYVDSENKRVSLSLLPHLVDHVQTGPEAQSEQGTKNHLPFNIN